MDVSEWPKHHELEEIRVGDRIQLSEEGKEELHVQDDKKGTVRKLTKNPDGIKTVHVDWDNYNNTKKHDPEMVERIDYPCYFCGYRRYIENVAPIGFNQDDIESITDEVKRKIKRSEDDVKWVWKCTGCAENPQQKENIKRY